MPTLLTPEQVRNGAVDEVFVFVDMQFEFGPSQEPWLIRNVQREILAAKRRGSPVIECRMDWAGPSYTVLTDHLYGGAYKRYALAQKRIESGAPAILDTCLEHGFKTDRFRVCGVNLDACLKLTVLGLIERRPQCTIFVPMDCCHGPVSGAMWGAFPTQSPNVFLIPTPYDDPLRAER